MRKITTNLVGIIIGAFSLVGVASAGGVGVGFKAGTLGVGAELSYPVNSFLTVGVGVNKYSSSLSQSASDIDYDVDLNLQTVSLLANFHPFSGSFRLTAGAMINSNELKMVADPAASYAIGGTTYPVAAVGELKAKVSFKKVAPYAGLGWGTSSDSGIGFTLDVGVLMQGEPEVDISAGALVSASDIAQEEANAEDDIKGFTMYPVMSAGVDIRF